jgi:hypothetical protein
LLHPILSWCYLVPLPTAAWVPSDATRLPFLLRTDSLFRCFPTPSLRASWSSPSAT